MIKIAHFSDLHYAGKTLAEADRCFSFAVDEAIAQRRCAVISGDSTDHALDVHAPAVAALARNVRRLADHCPVLMLQGTYSHEPPGTLDVFRLLGGRYPVFVADRIQQVALVSGRWQESESWRFESLPTGALFSCVPTVNKATVAPRPAPAMQPKRWVGSGSVAAGVRRDEYGSPPTRHPHDRRLMALSTVARPSTASMVA
jgi:exonuclease SbcD